MNRCEQIEKLGYPVVKQDFHLEVVVGNLNDYLTICMALRAPNHSSQEYWSFRGQRNSEWPLGIEYKFKGMKEAELDKHFDQFRKRCKEFPQPDYITSEDTWLWLYYAQHYGLSTRLLDWTTNPLVALYFAVENINSKVIEEGVLGAVWLLKVNKEDYILSDELKGKHIGDLKEWKMIDPPPITPRIARQSGKFTYHPSTDSIDLDKRERRKSNEELIKIKLLRDDGTNPSEEIRAQLGVMNMHHAYLFPDPHGIAKFINYEWPIIAGM